MEDSKDPGEFESADESPAPPDVGGYLVGHRTAFEEGGRDIQAEGVFHLGHRQGEWKIEDIYFTSFDRQPLENWRPVAKDYQQMAASAREQRAAPSRPGAPPGSPSSAKKQKPWYEQTGLYNLLARSFAGGGGKALGAVLLAVAVGVARFGKGILSWLLSASGQEGKTV